MKITIICTGYVCLVTAACLAESGLDEILGRPALAGKGNTL